MAVQQGSSIDQSVLLHDTKSALSVCAGFQAEVKSAMDALKTEIGDSSPKNRDAIDQIFVNDIDPCVEYLQITFDRIQVQLDLLCEHCRSEQ